MADVNDVGGNSSFDWGAAMNAVAEIGGAMITSGSGRKSQKRARQYSEELMRIQDELNDQNALDSFNRSVEAWNMQNAYNSPTAQRERLEDAGLNPALLYGNASGATVSNAGGLSPAPASSVGTQSVGVTPPVVFGNIAESIAQIDLLKSQANKNNAEAEDIRGETAPAKLNMRFTEANIKLTQALESKAISEKDRVEVQKNLDNLALSIGEATKQYTIDTARAELNMVKQNYRALAKQMEGLDIDNATKNLEMQNVAMSVVLKMAELEYFIKTGKTLTTTQIEQGEAVIDELSTRSDLNVATAGNVEGETEWISWRNSTAALASAAISIATLWGVGAGAKAILRRKRPIGFQASANRAGKKVGF